VEQGIRLDIAGGINTVASADQIPENGGGWPYLCNVRKNRKSMTVARYPLGSNLLASSLGAGITSVSRLNDPYKTSPSYAYISGSSGSLYVGTTQVASGLSTNPLSFLPYRPPDSPQPWDYIADPSLAVSILNPSYAAYGAVCGMLKVRSDGTCYKVGIKEPQTAPIVNVSSAASPYWVTYRYLYRSKITGALSNPSPESVPIQVELASQAGSYTMDPSYATYITYNTSQYEPAVSDTQLRTKGIPSGTLTDYIIAKDLPGLVGTVPTGSQVTGVSVSITWNGQNNGTGVLANVALFYQGAVIGQIKSPGTINTQTIQTTVQGGASDVWGAILTPDVVNDSTFGFGIQVLTEQSGSTNRSFFYTFTITVYYANFSATGTCTLSLDPQVDTIDVYRQTPGLDNFTYTLSIANSGSGSFTDTLSDLTIANNPILNYNNYEPFPSIDLPRSGTCNVLGVSEEVTAVGTVSPGSGQTPGTYPISAVGGGGTGAVVTVVIDGSGIISTSTPPVVTHPGSGYTSVPTFPLTFGGTPGTVSATISPILPLVPNVVWVSGDIFNVRWLPGTAILIADSTGSQIGYLLYNRPSDTTHMLVYNTTTTDTGFITFGFPPAGTGLTWQIIAPDLAAEPSPVIWGPTPDSGGGSFMMGLDPLNPGDLLTSTGNNFDSAPSSQRLYICSPSEGLVNGIVTSELHVVFSPERFWLLYPNFSDAVATVTGTTGPLWTPVQAAATRGLFMRYALGGLGALLAWRAKDGIFISQGGGPEQDISANIYNLFPHGEPEGPSPVVIGDKTIYPPDDTKPKAQTVTCVPGYIFYNYQDTTGTPRTLVFDMEAKGWVVDAYTPQVNCHALPVGINQILVGCTDGTIRAFDTASTESQTAVIITRSENKGSTRIVKRVGGVFLRAVAASAITLAFWANRIQTAITGFAPGVTGTGASESDYLVDFTSATNADVKDLACEFSWSITSGNILSEWQPDWTFLPAAVIGWKTGLLSYGPGWGHVEWINLAYQSTAAVTLVMTPDNGSPITLTFPSTGGAQVKQFLTFPPNKFKIVGWTANSSQPFTIYAGDTSVMFAAWGIKSGSIKPFEGWGTPKATT
jgi:hypothetical protein